MLAAGIVNSYKQLPLLVYQTCKVWFRSQIVDLCAHSILARKYRDEPRPRQGLLRTKEFLMKDLYTFDVSREKALDTYQRVRKAYNDFFDELRIRFVVARAASGDIGGDLSHEYHVPTASGEDTFIQCDSCTHAVNEEWVSETAVLESIERTTDDWGPYQSWYGISRDRKHIVEAVLPLEIRTAEHLGPQQKKGQINPHLIKALYPDLQLSIERPLSTFIEYWKENHSSGSNDGSELSVQPHLTRIYDYRISQDIIDRHSTDNSCSPANKAMLTIVGSRVQSNTKPFNLARFQDGDECPNCGEGKLKVLQTLELGHTFHLGQRYSRPMDATFVAQPKKQTNVGSLGRYEQDQSAPAKPGQEWFHMGCHGIGISRMIAAVTDALADEKGLIWPRVMAPYEVVILATNELMAAAEEVWDVLTLWERNLHPVEAVLDDRDKSLGWKLKDADLIGFPVVVILGSTFQKEKLCEVSVRRHNTREKIRLQNLKEYITDRLAGI